MPVYPQHEKLAKYETESLVVSGFLDFLSELQIHLAVFHKHDEDCFETSDTDVGSGRRRVCKLSDEVLYFARDTPEELIAAYFKIDLDAFHEEKRIMEAAVRAAAQQQQTKEKPNEDSRTT